MCVYAQKRAFGVCNLFGSHQKVNPFCLRLWNLNDIVTNILIYKRTC